MWAPRGHGYSKLELNLLGQLPVGYSNPCDWMERLSSVWKSSSQIWLNFELLQISDMGDFV